LELQTSTQGGNTEKETKIPGKERKVGRRAKQPRRRTKPPMVVRKNTEGLRDENPTESENSGYQSTPKSLANKIPKLPGRKEIKKRRSQERCKQKLNRGLDREAESRENQGSKPKQGKRSIFFSIVIAQPDRTK